MNSVSSPPPPLARSANAQPSGAIVVLGGGAGGLELAIRLAKRLPSGISKVVLVDKSPVHVWKPRLHEVAVGIIGSGDDEISYLAQAATHGFEFQWGEVIGIHAAARAVRLSRMPNAAGQDVLGERTLRFETLVIAIGSRVNDFGVDGVLTHCHLLDTPEQASALRRAFLEAAVQASAGSLETLSVGIVGAGATGIELAAELHHAAHFAQLYGRIGATDKLSITLIDQGARVLPAGEPATSQAIQAKLERLGIVVRLGIGVVGVSEDAIRLKSGEAVPCRIKVWASGVIGHDLVTRIEGLTIGKGRRIAIDPFLACVGLKGIYAIGDCAATTGDRAPSPPTAQVAHQQASYLANALVRRSRGEKVVEFVYQPRGMLVSLGASDATGELPALRSGGKKLATGGAFAKLLYTSLFHMHRVTLYGWWKTIALYLADRLRGIATPPIKLH